MPPDSTCLMPCGLFRKRKIRLKFSNDWSSIESFNLKFDCVLLPLANRFGFQLLGREYPEFEFQSLPNGIQIKSNFDWPLGTRLGDRLLEWRFARRSAGRSTGSNNVDQHKNGAIPVEKNRMRTRTRLDPPEYRCSIAVVSPQYRRSIAERSSTSTTLLAAAAFKPFQR